jgi:hypothetical protein
MSPCPLLCTLQNFFRCAEGQEAVCRKILEKKGVKQVTDMIYEARIAAVVRIEAVKKRSCPRKNALKLYPTAAEYQTVNQKTFTNLYKNALKLPF